MQSVRPGKLIVESALPILLDYLSDACYSNACHIGSTSPSSRSFSTAIWPVDHPNPGKIMFAKLFIAFAVLPVLEIYVLIHVGSVIGALNTVAIVLLTAFAGAWLARVEGMQTLLRIRQSMHQGVMPTNALIDAAIILAAGLLLLTPGFITDGMGLLLLFPPTRKLFKDWIIRALKDWTNNHPPTITYYRP